MITVLGLPAHPLIIHAVVVLVPLAALCALAVVRRPAWRRRYGWPVLILTLAAAISAPVAVITGDQLAFEQFGADYPEDIVAHQGWGELTQWSAGAFGLAMLLFIVLGWLFDRRAAGAPQPGYGPTSLSVAQRIVLVVLGLAVLAAAVASTILVFLAGDTGTTSVWGHITE
jgi:hypothetical protein